MPYTRFSQISEEHFLTPTFYADPYSFYEELQISEPVHWSTKRKAWMVTKYEDVSSCLRDDRLSVQRNAVHTTGYSQEIQREFDPLRSFYSLWLMYLDDPTHGRIRRIVNKAFLPRVIESSKSFGRQYANMLITRLSEHKEMNVLADFATPLTIASLANLLGVPSSDYSLIKKWSDDLVGFLGLGGFNLDAARRTQQSMNQLSSYIDPLVTEREANIKDDLLSMLIYAKDEAKHLTRDELLATFANILIDGHEPVANVIANGLLALLTHPQQYYLLRDNPQLLASSIEEILRFDPPFQYSGRLAKEDLTVRDTPIKAGEKLLIMLGAANRDPDAFHAADVFNIARESNGHRSFGFGIHFCVGSALARYTLEAAFSALIGQLPKLSLPKQTIEWHSSLGYRGMKELHITWE